MVAAAEAVLGHYGIKTGSLHLSSEAKRSKDPFVPFGEVTTLPATPRAREAQYAPNDYLVVDQVTR